MPARPTASLPPLRPRDSTSRRGALAAEVFGWVFNPSLARYPLARHAPVAQLDRAPDYESGGQRFESFRARHSFVRLRASSAGLLRSCVTALCGHAPSCRMDYGCGRGNDLRLLAVFGYSAYGWDTVYRPNGSRTVSNGQSRLRHQGNRTPSERRESWQLLSDWGRHLSNFSTSRNLETDRSDARRRFCSGDTWDISVRTYDLSRPGKFQRSSSPNSIPIWILSPVFLAEINRGRYMPNI